MPLNATSAVILGVLHDGAATGGEIVAAASQRLAAQGGVTRSQVYRELPALAAAGLVHAPAPAEPTSRRASRPYALTAAGRQTFAEWAGSANGADSVRSHAVLRLGFGAHLPAAERRRIVADARAEHQAALAGHERAAAALRAAGDTFGAVTVEFAVAYERAVLGWLERVPVE